MSAVIENSCPALLTAGLMQGAFELLFEHENTGCEWEVRPDGDLNISIFKR